MAGIVDTKQLEQRLVLKESVIGASSLVRCANKLGALKDNKSDQKALESFLRELSLYRLEIEKSSRSIRSFDLQLEEYAALEASINDKMFETTQEIQRLQQELKQETEVRAHRKELEDFAIIVNRHQSTSSTKKKIEEAVENLSSTKESLCKVDNEISVRLGQVERLMEMIGELGTKLSEDDQGEAADEDNDRGEDRHGRADNAAHGDEIGEGDNEIEESGDVDGGMTIEADEEVAVEDGELTA